MSLEEAARDELLRMRKTADGVTVGALARTDALRQVLGGGDPRVAYNALKHVLLNHADDLAVTAAGYSLGYASDGSTHLDRLIEFGRLHGYDQRQARRYSDRGIIAVARHIGSEWTLEASPVLRVVVIRADNAGFDLLLQAERLDFIEMGEPNIELVADDRQRRNLEVRWVTDASNPAKHCEVAHITIIPRVVPGKVAQYLSILWTGEVWPKFEVGIRGLSGPATRMQVETMAARLQISWEDPQPVVITR